MCRCRSTNVHARLSAAHVPMECAVPCVGNPRCRRQDEKRTPSSSGLAAENIIRIVECRCCGGRDPAAFDPTATAPQHTPVARYAARAQVPVAARAKEQRAARRAVRVSRQLEISIQRSRRPFCRPSAILLPVTPTPSGRAIWQQRVKVRGVRAGVVCRRGFAAPSCSVPPSAPSI